VNRASKIFVAISILYPKLAAVALVIIEAVVSLEVVLTI